MRRSQLGKAIEPQSVEDNGLLARQPGKVEDLATIGGPKVKMRGTLSRAQSCCVRRRAR